MKQKMRSRSWRMAVTCLSAVIIFVTTYALVMPAITKTGSYPSLQAEEVTAVSGEELAVRVTAKADAGEEDKTVILIADGEGADLSASYVFNEEGICVITDETGKEIELHRSVRENSSKKQVIDYWFTLLPEEETSFTLELIDEVDENRFAKLVEAVQESAQASEDTAAAAGKPGTATASDAEKAASAAGKAASGRTASASNASRATGSNADVIEANAVAVDPEERIVTEENDSGFVEILDGKVVNDLTDADSSDDEDEEKVRATLRLSAGIGTDYASSVKDAERNADKRGDAELKFTWTERPEESRLVKPDLAVSVGDAKIAVICDDETVLPADARISAYEIAFGTPEYEALAAQAAGAVAESAGGNEKSVTRARFFDITICDGDGNEIQPEGDVKVVITYEKQNASEDDGEMNVVHFGEDGPEVLDLDAAETAADRDSMEFTASSFSIYGAVYTVDSENEPDSTDQPAGAENTGLTNSRQVADGRESDDLADFISKVLITGAVQTADGKYQVEEGKEYSFIITFAENSEHQFLNKAPLTYQMPAGIKILSKQTGSSVINIVYKGRTYPVDYTYELDTDGKLTILFDQSDPDFPRLEESTNVSFRFIYSGQFDGSETKILFSQEMERDIVLDGPRPGNAFAQKSASYDEKNGKFAYTVTVTADGDVKNVNVRDIITGSVLIFNNDVIVTGNSSSFTDNHAASGFDYTFASMKEGEVIRITYTADVDFSKDTDKDGRISVDQTKNTVTVKPEGGDPHTSEYSREIAYKTTYKSDGAADGKTESGNKIILWTIDYNSLALAPAGGDTITDSIDGSSAAYMKYYGDGITVEVRDHSGNLVGTRQVSYDSLASYSDSTWTYKIPETDTAPYSYRITYRTVVDMAKVDKGGVAVSIGNKANDAWGGVYVTPDNGVGIVKEVESFTTKEVNWVATLSIPEGGLEQAVVTDSVPRIYLDQRYMDPFKEGSLQITGLLPDESYTYTYNASSGMVVITFYQDAGKKVPGLKGTPGGHQINVRLTTQVDQDWLQEGYENGDYVQNHTNTISLNGQSTTATVIFGKPGIVKSGEPAEQSGSFMYTVILSGVSEVPVRVEDTFDTSLLEVDTSMTGVWGDHMKIWGGTQHSQTLGKTAVSYTDTQDGIILTANSVPMQPDGHYYPYYRIVYYLRLKEGVDLEKLAVLNGGEHDLVNTAKWNGHESSFTYKTEYDYLDKKLLNEGELGGTNRTAQYQITFNKAKAILNNGEPMTMTDTLSSNLSVDYGSISIAADPEGTSVPYSLSGGEGGTTVATYTVPDATEVVITYNALIIGNNTQTISNKVSVMGKDKTVVSEISDLSDTSGQGNVASFKIVKVDGYDASKKLSGVRFKVFAQKPTLDFGEKVNHAKEIELVTDEKGEICLDGEAYDLYFNEVYHVQEIEPPEGYGGISFDYKVMLTSDMDQVDYGLFIYYYSDSMQIKNVPLEGLVVEKQVESDELSDKEQYYPFRISILNDDGTVNTGYNEKIGDDQFVNGVFEFELKDKEQKMFRDFSKGTKYKVEETDAKGLTASVSYSIYDKDGNAAETVTETESSHTGILTQEDEVIVFKNVNRKAGSIKVHKDVRVNGSVSNELNGQTIKVGLFTGTEEPAGAEAAASETAASMEMKITKEMEIADGSGEVTFEDLDPGTYYVYELDAENQPVKNGGTILLDGRVYVVEEESSSAAITRDSLNAEIRIVNKREFGSLKVEKTVTYNGQGGSTAAKMYDKLAGTYTFTLYTDEAHQDKYQKDGKDVTAVLTIPEDCSPVVSDEIEGIPAGTYYLWEEVPEGSEAVPEMNPVPVIVEAGRTGDEAVIAKFRNNYTDAPDEAFLSIRKTFAGITREMIPEGFMITIRSTDGEVEKTLDRTAEGFSISDDGLVWSWKLTGIPADKAYIITELKEEGGESVSTAEISGYTLVTEGFDEEKTVTAPAVEIKEFDIETRCSTTTWPVGAYENGRFLFAASLTSQGTLIVTEERLSEGQRKWVEETLLPALREEDSNVWKDPAIYYSTEEHPNGFTISDGNAGSKDKHVFCMKDRNEVELEDTSLWQHVARVGYTYISDHAEFETKNTYTEVTEISRLKSWAGSAEWPADTKVTMTLSVSVDGTEILPVRDTAGHEVETAAVLDADHRTAEWTNLPKYDENKNEITYAVTETKVTVGNSEFTGDDLTARWTVADENGVITNTPVVREFEFSKVWMNSGKVIRWPERVAGITVTLKRTAQAADGSRSVEETAVFTVSPDSITENTGSGFAAHAEKLPGEDYRYKITDLDKYSSDGTEWSYSISEAAVEGFNKPAYYTIDDDGVKREQLSSEKSFFAAPGTTGGVEIVNDEITIVIPSTGGPGTTRYTLSGIALLMVSALMYCFRLRRRIIQVPDGQ